MGSAESGGIIGSVPESDKYSASGMESANGLEPMTVRELERLETGMFESLLNVHKTTLDSHVPAAQSFGDYTDRVLDKVDLRELGKSNPLAYHAFVTNQAVAGFLLNMPTLGLKVKTSPARDLTYANPLKLNMPPNWVHIISPTSSLNHEQSYQAMDQHLITPGSVLVAHKGFSSNRQDRPLHIVTNMEAAKTRARSRAVEYSVKRTANTDTVLAVILNRRDSGRPTVNINLGIDAQNIRHNYKVTTYAVARSSD